MSDGILRLETETKAYAWGSRTAIPGLLGLPTPSPGPVAELWVGAHPGGPSRAGGAPLPRLIAEEPERILGARVRGRHGDRLPLLLKLLAADEPLSIQAHPSKAQAEAGFAREEAAGVPREAPHRNYRDDNHKPELLVALGPFRALCGFRDLDEIAALLAPLGLELPGGKLPALFASIWGPDHRALALRVEAAAARAVLGELPDVAREAYAEVLALGHRYSGDPGILAPLFLNLVTLEPGQGLYLGAGELHAYLEGFGIELMASSDNVLRGGLTPKHVDVDELLRTLTFRSGRPPVLAPDAEGVYHTPAPDFRLAVIEGPRRVTPDGPELLLGLSGETSLVAGEEAPIALAPGQAALVCATVRSYTVSGGRIARAFVP